MSASYDTLLRLAALTRSTVDDDLRELDRALDTLHDADITLLFFALAAVKNRTFQLCVPAPGHLPPKLDFDSVWFFLTKSHAQENGIEHLCRWGARECRADMRSDPLDVNLIGWIFLKRK